MSDRVEIILANRNRREEAVGLVAKARPGSRVEIKGPQRTPDQNTKIHAMLGELAAQATWKGHTYTPAQWKDLMTAGCAQALLDSGEAIQGLEGGLLVFGRSTSDMSLSEASDLLTYMTMWGEEHGVVFVDSLLYDVRT